MPAKKQTEPAPATSPRRRAASAQPRGPGDVLRDIHLVADSARESGDLRTALRALELEGRHLGLFGPSGDDQAPQPEITLYQLPDNRRD